MSRVIAERECCVPCQLVLGAAISLLIDQGWYRDADPFLTGAGLPARVLASAKCSGSWLLRWDKAIPVGAAPYRRRSRRRGSGARRMTTRDVDPNAATTVLR